MTDLSWFYQINSRQNFEKSIWNRSEDCRFIDESIHPENNFLKNYWKKPSQSKYNRNKFFWKMKKLIILLSLFDGKERCSNQKNYLFYIFTSHKTCFAAKFPWEWRVINCNQVDCPFILTSPYKCFKGNNYLKRYHKHHDDFHHIELMKIRQVFILSFFRYVINWAWLAEILGLKVQ